jgi:hypothetical protein
MIMSKRGVSKSHAAGFFPKNKKGQELSTNAIVLIILAVIILVILVIGFIVGWDKVKSWISSTNNVDTVSKACQTSCTTNNQFDFCSMQRDLKDNKKSFTDSCKNFATNASYSIYAIADCPNLCSP